ncbi:uncharacterized protein LOC126888206 [Diabrotica virgifera virgifera]|uniref:MADF domain-containing protein n=1 Tax=Diabrotica virgifera virgifera TaxID=50390 RepID=A0ABM5KPV7_DIAVI|nr:uncharacterized protein LOC126888206 [Diabrotica virgifera virgifera]
MEGVCDNDALINAMKSQDIIWNYKLPDYSNKTNRNSAWEIICSQIVENYDELTVQEQNKIVTLVQKKWKVLRDGYTRYAKRIKSKSGSSAPVRPYQYYEQMSFLKAVTEDKPDETNSLEESDYAEIMTMYEDSDFPEIMLEESEYAEMKTEESENENKKCRTRSQNAAKQTSNYKRKLNNAMKEDIIPEKLSKLFEEKSQKSSNAEDEEKFFLLSLVGDFKKISDQHKLDAKLEILNIIKHYQGMSHDIYPTSSSDRGYSTQNSSLPNDYRGQHNSALRGYSTGPSTSSVDDAEDPIG